MENQENELENSETVKPGEAQQNGSGSEQVPQESEDAGYTEEEVEFADGEGSVLQREFEDQ